MEISHPQFSGSISIPRANLKGLLVYLQTTQLFDVMMIDIFEEFERLSGLDQRKDDKMTLSVFLEAIRNVREIDSGSSDAIQLDKALLKVFRYFDKEQTGVADFNEILVAAIITCSGTARSKLLFIFGLLDADGDSRLEFSELAIYCRAVITVIAATCLPGNIPIKEITKNIDGITNAVTSSVFEDLAVSPSGKISFQELEKWLTVMSQMSIPWFHQFENLLNLAVQSSRYDIDVNKIDFSKSLPGQIQGIDTNMQSETYLDANPAEEDPFEIAEVEADMLEQNNGEEQIIYEFPMAKDSNHLIRMSLDDIKNLEKAINISGLGNSANTPENQHQLFMKHIALQDFASVDSKSQIDVETFKAFIRDLVPGDDLSPEDSSFLTTFFFTIFYNFARQHSLNNNAMNGDSNAAAAACDEIMTGISILSHGSKSEKLSLAFDRFDVDGDGLLSKRELWRFMRSFLTFIISIARECSMVEQSHLFNLVDDLCVELCGTIFNWLKNNQSNDSRGAMHGKVSFEEFGRWYNVEGHSMIPWLELLDLSKWPITIEEKADKSSSAISTTVSESTQDPLFEFLLTDSGEFLKFYTEDATTLHELVQISGLSSHSPEKIQQVILWCAGDKDESITLSEVCNVVSMLIRVTMEHTLDELNVSDAKDVSDSIDEYIEEITSFTDLIWRNLFDLLYNEDDDDDDIDDDDDESEMKRELQLGLGKADQRRVRAHSVAAAMSLFAAGSKSEKLSSAWEHFDGDDDGKLNKNELCTYLQSFLCALTSFSIEGFQDIESDKIKHCIKIGAYEATEKVFSQSGCGRTISFHDFGKWYTEGGFHLCPWLELLDIKKWKPSLSTTEEGSGSSGPSIEDENEAEGDGKDDDSTDPVEFLFANDTDTNAESREFIDENDCLTLRKSSVDSLETLLSLCELHTKSCVEISISLLSVVALDYDFSFSDAFLDYDEESQLGLLLQCVPMRERCVRRDIFDMAIRYLVDGSTLVEEEKNSVSQCLWQIFYAFASSTETTDPNTGDITEVDAARADEICAALSVLARGSKSEKLDHVFLLFNSRPGVDEEPLETVNKRQMWRFIRAFRTTIEVIASSQFAATSQTTWAGLRMGGKVVQIIDDVSTHIVEKLFAWNAQSSSWYITFESFAEWYTVEGFRIVPWLELLDLRKWRMRNLFASFVSKAQLLAEEATGNVDGVTDSPEVNPIFEFTLNSDGDTLSVCADDVDFLTVVVKATGLHKLDPRDIFSALVRYGSVNGYIDKAAFDNTIRLLVPGETIYDDMKEFLSVYFNNVYHHLAFEGALSGPATSISESGGNPPFAKIEELSASLCLFAAGSKSEKLSSVWPLFDVNETGCLTRDQLYEYLKSFLSTIMVVSKSAISDESELNEDLGGLSPLTSDQSMTIHEEVERTCVEVVETIFEQCDVRGDAVSFDDFASWYTNSGGHELIPWVELLDLTKWPGLVETNEDNDNEEDMVLEDVDEDDEEEKEEGDVAAELSAGMISPTTVFKFPLTDLAEDQVIIDQADVHCLMLIIAATQLDKATPETILSVFESCQQPYVRTHEENTLSRADFDRALLQLIPAEYLSTEEKEYLNFIFDNYFSSFDYGTGEVRLDEIASAFLLFTSGTKSEKLSFAFSLFCRQERRLGLGGPYKSEENQVLTKESFCRFLNCFLTCIASITEQCLRNSPQEVWMMLHRGSTMATELIFSQVEEARKTGKISFESFADWYTSGGGSKFVPWCELLSLSKWPVS
eukprot:g1924.t1